LAVAFQTGIVVWGGRVKSDAVIRYEMLKKSPELKNIFRIDQSAKNGYRENHGWQVRIGWYGEQHTKFFRDSKFANKEEGLRATKKYRNELTARLEKEIGPACDFKPGGVNVHKIKLTLPKNNKSGILGVTRLLTTQRNGARIPIWQASYPTLDGSTGFKRLSCNKLGEIGALYKAIELRIEGISVLIGTKKYENDQENIQILVDRYLNIMVFLEELDDQKQKELIDVVNDNTIINTKKEDIILGRVGQKSFQDKIKHFWKNKCAITGSEILLTAGHIKPWKISSDRERLDVYNGILLSPNYDKAFDYGYISFENDGNIILAKSVYQALKLMGIIESNHIDGFTPFHHKYLEYHRNNVLRSNV
jgi:HNH endonuclease